MSIREFVRLATQAASLGMEVTATFKDTVVIGEDMHELARAGKIILDLSNETRDPLVDAMYDYRPFSWRVSKAVQYGPIHNPNARDIRRKLASLNR